MNIKDLPLNDLLTVEMTYLSNERSMLSYMRTFMVFLSSGIAILKIELLNPLMLLGYISIALSVVILIIGIYRFFTVKKNVKRILKNISKKQL